MKPTLDDRTTLKVADQKGRLALGSRYARKHIAVREEPDGTTVLTPVSLVPDKDLDLTAHRLTACLSALEALRNNWDGRRGVAPSSALVDHAREVVAMLHAGAMTRGIRWEVPHVGSNERGQITLEWWSGPRTLTIFVRDIDQIEFLKAWGSDIASEMEDGEISRLSDFGTLSNWLFEGNQPA